MDANPLDEKNKLLGSNLLVARESSEKTLTRAAGQLGVTSKAIKSYESGRSAPSLPQLELLAGLYRVPIESILSASVDMPTKLSLPAEKVADFIEIRNRIIAATIKHQRLSQKISMKKLAAAVGIRTGMLRKFETGATSIPEPVLQALCSQLGIAMDSLLSPLTAKTEKVRTTTFDEQDTSALSNEIREFIQNPANLPYLELAKRLSEMDAAKLRAIAEDLLEITY